MTARDILVWGSKRLHAAKIDSASLDAEILLARALKKTKEFLAAHPEYPVSRSRLTAYRKLIGRRAKHEPIAYITGRKEFYGLNFSVDRRVLIPRPETELMVDEILKLLPTRYPPATLSLARRAGSLPATLVDIGTGSGCIIISLANLLSTPYSLHAQFFATDASPTALTLARRNARLHGVEKKITFLHGNLLDPFFKNYSLCTMPRPARHPEFTSGHATRPQRSRLRGGRAPYTLIITANLPYLPTAEWRRTPPDVKNFEPRLALDGGPDGLKYYHALLKQLKEFSTRYSLPATHLFFELCPHQAGAITKLARKFFPRARVEIKKDLAGRKRLAVVSF